MNTESTPVRGQIVNHAAYSADGLQVMAGAGKLLTFRMHYKGTVNPVYLQFHNVASTPADGEAPYLPPIPVIIGATGGAYYESDTPLDFPVGCYACLSSTAATKTIIVAADGWMTATKL